MRRLYGKKYNQKSLYLCIYAGFYLLHVWVNVQQIVMFNIVYGACIIQFIGYFLYRDAPQKFLYNFLLQVYLCFMDSGFIAIYSVFFEQSPGYSLGNETDFLFSGVFVYLSILFSYRPLIRFFQQCAVQFVPHRFAIFISLFSLWQLYVVLYFTPAYFPDSNVSLLFFIFSFGFFDLSILYLLGYVGKHRLAEARANLYHQTVMLSQNLQYTEEKNTAFRRIIHDCRNHLQLIEQMKDMPIQQQAYMENLEYELNKLSGPFRSGHHLLDLIINGAISNATEKGIRITAETASISWDFLKNIDMTTIFSNLLNNAMEACESINNDRRFIEIRMKEKHGFAILIIRNSCLPSQINQQDGTFLSTKECHRGIGIGNVRRTAEKYGGELRFCIKDQVFNAQCALSIKTFETA